MNSELIKSIIESELSFDSYFLLKIIRDNEAYLYPKLEQKFKSQLDLLLYFGFLTISEKSYSITLKGRSCLINVEKYVKKDERVEKSFNKYEQLFLSLQTELAKVNNGRKQVKANGEYAFFPNLVDFESKLSKVIKKYNLPNWDKIKQCLINHIIKSKKQNWSKVQLLGYYIEKSGFSTLATDYDSMIEIKEEKRENLDNSVKSFEI